MSNFNDSKLEFGLNTINVCLQELESRYRIEKDDPEFEIASLLVQEIRNSLSYNGKEYLNTYAQCDLNQIYGENKPDAI